MPTASVTAAAAAAAAASVSASHAAPPPLPPHSTLAPSFVEAMAAILEDAVAQLQVLAEIAPALSSVSLASPATAAAAPLPATAAGGGGGGGGGGGTAPHPSAGLSDSDTKTGRERQMLESLLEKSIAELRINTSSTTTSGGCLPLRSLQAAVDDEVTRRSQLSDTQQRERDRIVEARDMQRQLHLEASDLDAQRAERDGVIVQLREAIQEINALTAAEQRYVTRGARARENAHRAQCSAREVNADIALSASREAASTEARMHACVMTHLAARRRALETQIVAWMERHERDTDAKGAELDALKACRLRDNDKFEEYAARYDELEQQIHEDQVSRSQEIELRRARGDLMRRESAARIIQREWRAHIAAKRGAGGQGSASSPSQSAGGRGGSGGRAPSGRKGGNSAASGGSPRSASSSSSSSGASSSAKKKKKKK